MTSKNTFNKGDLVIVKSSDSSEYKQFIRKSPLSIGFIRSGPMLPERDGIFWVSPPNYYGLANIYIFSGEDLILIKKE